MTPNDFYYTKSKEEVESVALAAGTSFSNFKQIAIAKGSVSKALAEKLTLASGGLMTELEILYPERYQVANIACPSEKAA